MWMKEVEDLAIIAKSHPQAAYAAFTHGLTSKWTYLMRTVSVTQQCLQPLEDAIRQQLLSALTGKTDISDIERELISLPARLGGLSIPNPTVTPPTEHNASLEVTAPLVEAICEQHGEYNVDTMAQQQQCKVKVKSKKRRAQMAAANSLHPQLPQKLQKLMEVAKEKGSSSWLVALPIESHGFSLHKGAFRDALCLRYGWQPPLLPTTCACGKSFTIDHALNCPTGGFPIVRHNEIRDLTADLMSEVCHDVCVEPTLQTLTGEQLSYATANREDSARLDVRAGGFWGLSQQSAFFDVRVVNPFAPACRSTQMAACYRRHEGEKRRAYEQRVREVEQGSFTPLVFSTSGGMGRAATVVYKRLASLLSSRREQPYSMVMGWLRCRLSFSLLRSAVMCLRGSRSRRNHAPRTSIDLAVHEGRIPLMG